jgi:hypothetical protein
LLHRLKKSLKRRLPFTTFQSLNVASKKVGEDTVRLIVSDFRRLAQLLNDVAVEKIEPAMSRIANVLRALVADETVVVSSRPRSLRFIVRKS